MQLTGKQIVDEGIITGYCEEGIQQQGIDLRIVGINQIYNEGFIPAIGKTVLPEYRVMEPIDGPDGKKVWGLAPGYYEILLEEGCNIPKNRVMVLVQRSSLARCGALIASSQFDAGFKTDHMGTFMDVRRPVVIEQCARVCQCRIQETEDVDNLYDGQWQNDKQRK